jgi:hypothetical protein
MSGLSLSWTSVALSIISILGASFAFVRWSRVRTNRALANALLFLALASNTALTALNSSGFSTRWAVSVLIALSIVLLGLTIYFMVAKEDASPTA